MGDKGVFRDKTHCDWIIQEHAHNQISEYKHHTFI